MSSTYTLKNNEDKIAPWRTPLTALKLLESVDRY
jgi:hypothetical protein